MTTKADSTGQAEGLAQHTPNCRPASKWAAVLNDRLLQMPRRVVLAKDIKHEAGIGPEFALVRDFNSPHDTVFTDDAEVVRVPQASSEATDCDAFWRKPVSVFGLLRFTVLSTVHLC